MSWSDETSVAIQERNDRKSVRKQKRAHHRLLKDMNIKCAELPTQHLMICNGGLVTGIKRETLQCVLDALISKYTLIMPAGKSYCFVTCNSREDATCVYNYIHGRIKLPGQNGPLYVCYTETVSTVDDVATDSAFPPGLTLMENFITEEQAESLLETLTWDEESASSQLKHRQVKHFGYEFEYGTNMVDIDKPIAPIPQSYKFLQTLFDKHGHKYTYDQLTINKYLPGQGIPSHIDTHSVFEDTILSLSLGSACVMNFKKDRKIDVLLPARSLLIMGGEARYAWAHGICPRRSDVIETKNGSTTQERGTRVSFTFRKVRRGDCHCDFKDYCDTAKCDTLVHIDRGLGLESSYVHRVYEEIASHFNETRYKQWPNVIKFLESLEEGTLLLDVGCGNGKYLCGGRNVYKMGCDRSSGLMDICHKRGFEVLQCDCLYLPYRDDSVDAVISIAVIHHLSTQERRQRAISEMIRVLRPRGRCLIYVWAMEQRKNSMDSAYLKSGKRSKETGKIDRSGINHERTSECRLTLPIHENRTNFTHSDMLVPWKMKSGEKFLRYYHVFREYELAKLCTEIPAAVINKVYYDQGNWCVILEKCTRVVE
ncbi:PREDICTED: alkylated DNA repair protein alkB homolog 8 [Vollenhovia emeryi]|uniref:alkylated DNA repair protein alkB homolog 8 n=1 Tax=Vollenhovia emeryi TaxID=411798 RepID=UPI0005F569E5|nr:PREDICTED: alkylated DNA repair protein alkB homolog 8 [Vollenhovia emeryi]XP_011883389.1 PREDICTED: alkylated DNA repair protein alkB homolog 8 [Vollenhovia emeryi]XP_011883390.1 PREDICTED: alkylated DNA repair protein alkB homolog 8 [Vollenhovia emeryi]